MEFITAPRYAYIAHVTEIVDLLGVVFVNGGGGGGLDLGKN